MVITARRGLLRVGRRRDRRYLDFSSQLVFTNIGHQHPRVVAAIKEQAEPALHDRAGGRQRHRAPRPPG